MITTRYVITTHMRKDFSMIRRLAGAVASFLAMLAGLWLILAPFALGAQPKDADWTHETFTNVWSGIGLGVLGLIGAVAFSIALVQHLRARGLITPRAAKNQATHEEPQNSAAPEPAAPSAPAAGDLDKLIAPLVDALTTDLERDHTNGRAAADSDHSREPVPAGNNSSPRPARADN